MADVRVEDEGVASPGPGDTRGDTGGASQEATGGPDGVPPQVAAELSPEVTVRGDTLYLNTSPAGLAGVVPVEDGIYRIVLDAGEVRKLNGHWLWNGRSSSVFLCFIHFVPL